MNWSRCAILILAVVVTPQAAAAQTRAEIAQQARAEKSKTLHPYKPDKVERALFLVEDKYLVQRIFNPPNGLFLRVGGLPQGSGLPLGPGYRFSNDTVSAFGYGVLAPVSGYWDVGTEVWFNHLFNHHAFVAAGARRMDLPQEDFFGIGIDSTEDLKTSYALKQSVFHVRGGNNPGDLFQLVGRLSYETPRQRRGEDERIPSIEDVFTPAQAPGLFQDTDFLRTGAAFTIDASDFPLGPRVGGLYTFSFEKFSDRNLERFSFSQWAVDLRQFVPIVDGSRSIAVRLFATSARPDSGNEVPYYYLPTLGGAYMVRELANYRFRDRNVVFTNIEYRYELNAFMTGVAFYDAGTVAPTMHALSLRNLQWDYGFGVRFGFMGSTTMRTELAFGGEGIRFVFRFSDVF
jgi:hypothetical protein